MCPLSRDQADWINALRRAATERGRHLVSVILGTPSHDAKVLWESFRKLLSICEARPPPDRRIRHTKFSYISATRFYWSFSALRSWRLSTFETQTKNFISYKCRRKRWHHTLFKRNIDSIMSLTHQCLLHGDAVWRRRPLPILVKVMACCPIAPSHYLNHYWLSSVRSCGIHLRTTSQEILKISMLDVSLKITHKITVASPKGQWVNLTWSLYRLPGRYFSKKNFHHFNS